jgi:16S rRNA (cytosine967-C5)-methyltransferase
VNAVLRRIARDHRDWTPPALADDPVAHVRDALSMPDWLARRFVEDWGAEEAAAFAAACNQPPPLTVRVNAARFSRDALLEDLRARHPDAVACARAPHGIVLARKGDPRRDPGFVAGDFTVQDEASQLVIEMLGVQADDHVLDVCAAPGTKATGIAELLGPEGRVLALDRHPERLKLVARACRRLGIAGLRTIARDATRPLGDLPSTRDPERNAIDLPFDRVLVDAPCSGIGSLRRNPDARWRVQPGDPAQLATLQGRILDQAVAVLRPGGTLVYSTCTVLPEENEDVLEAFLDRHEECRLAAPGELPESVRPWLDERGLLHTWPQRHDADGFFAARIVKRAQDE